VIVPAILIVDDYRSVRTLLHDWLQSVFPDADFYEACDGESAVDQAILRKPDAVLMDINLPGINGIEATQRIREASPGTRVVMVTIQEGRQYREDALRAGASAYILKREAHSTLVATLRELLQVDRLAGTNGGDRPAKG
jgi:DNA-binding NarL/FixJ family response regulator